MEVGNPLLEYLICLREDIKARYNIDNDEVHISEIAMVNEEINNIRSCYREQEISTKCS